MEENFVIHRSNERGGANYGWLDTKHSFSFAHYYNPSRMGFGALRVLNEDFIAPQSGFQTHPHKDMEIVSIVTQGALSHKDTEGNSGSISSGIVQRMSAGKGIWHSEMNLGKDDPVHLFQVWLDTKENGIKPGYEDHYLEIEDRQNKLLLIASGFDNHNGQGLYIHQNAEILLGNLEAKGQAYHVLKVNNNGSYVHIIDGALDVNGHQLETGDAIEITGVNKLNFHAMNSTTDFLVFDVPLENYLDPRIRRT